MLRIVDLKILDSVLKTGFSEAEHYLGQLLVPRYLRTVGDNTVLSENCVV